MTLEDSTRKYNVTSRLIFDLDFVFTFFGDQGFTLKNIEEKTTEICEKWNYKYSDRPEVQKLIFLPPYPIPKKNIFLC